MTEDMIEFIGHTTKEANNGAELLNAAKLVGVWMALQPRLRRDDEMWSVYSRLIAAIAKAEDRR
jgi:hypothetical protein